jgi:acyl carrier protein
VKLDRDQLRAFLRDQLGLPTEDLADDDLLFSTGRLDSFSMVDLILFVEASLGRRMAAGDVRMDNLDSLSRILAWAKNGGG